MQVLVAGGTGFIGTHVCRELADRGHDVTALSRSRDAEVPHENVTTATGDVTDFGSVAGHVEGKDVVVNLVALSPLFEPRGGAGRQAEVHVGGTDNLCRAALECGVDRFVQQSSNGADSSATTSHLRAKARGEAVVRESGLEYAVLRPSVVFGDGDEFTSFVRRVTTPFVTGLPGGGRLARFQPIWVGDLAPMTADAATEPEHADRTFALGGPEVLSLRDVTKLVRPGVTVVPIPMALARVGLTVGGAIPGFPMGPDQYEGLKLDNTTPENDVTAFGREPASLRTFADYLQGNRGS